MADLDLGQILADANYGAAATLDGTEYTEIEQGGGTRIATVNQVYDYLNTKAYTDITLTRFDETIEGSATSALDRADGGIQVLTLTADVTVSVTINNGESLTLHLNAGASYTVTWPTMTWVGGSVPTLTANDVIEFWKVGGTLYGAYVGSVA